MKKQEMIDIITQELNRHYSNDDTHKVARRILNLCLDNQMKPPNRHRCFCHDCECPPNNTWEPEESEILENKRKAEQKQILERINFWINHAEHNPDFDFTFLKSMQSRIERGVALTDKQQTGVNKALAYLSAKHDNRYYHGAYENAIVMDIMELD